MNEERDAIQKKSYTSFGKLILAEEKSNPIYSIGTADRFAVTGDIIEIPKDTIKYQVWINAMQQAEKNYMDLASMGAKPDELSLVLPQSTAAEFVITANIRAWNNIFNLRAVGHSRPCVRQIMQPTLEMFRREIPIVFDDVYNKMIKEKQR